MQNKSLIDYSFDILSSSKKPLSLKDLFDKACKVADVNYSEDEVKKQMAALYTSLSTDGRFALMEDYTWDLRNRHKLEDILKNQVDYDTEDSSEEDVDVEEREYLNAELGVKDDELDSENANEGEFDGEEKPSEEDEF